MTTNRSFDRELESWLATEAPMTAPAPLHDTVIERAGRLRQHPAWLVAVRGETFGGSVTALGRPRTRITVLVLLGLVLFALMAALVVGALRTVDAALLGGNGQITYTWQGTNRTIGGTHLVQADGTGEQHMPLGQGCPTFSRDGSASVVTMDGGLVRTEARTGTTIVPLERLDSTWHPHDGSYALSPDGSRIAWLKALGPIEDPRPTELWVTQVADGIARRLLAAPSDPAIRLGPPAWSPDGRRLAFASHVSGESGHRTALDVIDVETGSVRRLTTRPATNEPGLSWSPDGRFIAYAGLPDDVAVPTGASGDPSTAPRHDIFVVGADGTGERNITNSPAHDQLPAWSPDGERLAYLSSEDGDTYRLTTLALDGGTPIAAPTTGPAFEFVVWSPDGTRLLWADSVPIAATARQSTTNITTLRSIDRDFIGPSTALASFDGSLSCAPAWQRVEP